MVELMVVVMVIGIIAAIAIPNLQAGLKKARRTACYTNMKVFEGALQRHILERDGPPTSLNVVTLEPLIQRQCLSVKQRRVILASLTNDRLSWYWGYDGGFGWDYDYIVEFKPKKEDSDVWCYVYPEGIWRWDNTDGWQQVM